MTKTNKGQWYMLYNKNHIPLKTFCWIFKVVVVTCINTCVVFVNTVICKMHVSIAKWLRSWGIPEEEKLILLDDSITTDNYHANNIMQIKLLLYLYIYMQN